MKRGLILALILFIFGGLLIKCSPINAQSGTITEITVRNGEVGIRAENLGAYDITVYGESIKVLNGIYAINGDEARICGWCVPALNGYLPLAKADGVIEVITLVDFNNNSLEYVINYEAIAYRDLTFIQRVWYQLTRQWLCEIF